jgi:aspartate aminotransferase
MRKLSISKHLRDKTVITSAISKCHGAGGWRLGFAIIPDELDELKDVILKVASETFSAVAAPI